MPLEKDLFENHLEFFANHQGTVIRRDGWVLVDSSTSEFVVAFAEEGARLGALPARFTRARLLPWSRLTPDELATAGFRAASEFAYWSLSGTIRPPPTLGGDVSIDLVTSRTAMDIFGTVEASSFREESDTFDWWHAWLRQKNCDGLSRELQRFYVASIDGEPASVAIGVLLDRVVGIYGVATLPEHRKKGLSSALLSRAIADARETCPDAVALQVVKAATSAEAFTKRLGFTLTFVSSELVR